MRRALAVSSVALAQSTIVFQETFGEGWESRWTVSEWKKPEGTQGRWEASAGRWHGDEKEDAGIQTAEDSKFFGISAAFPEWANEGKETIIQYQAKYEKDVECGGGYLKVGGAPGFDGAAFGDPTPYSIMFGPDKCGYTKRTHLIFNYEGKNVLKKTDIAYKQDDEGTSHLYRLTLKPDNTVVVDIDQEEIYKGSIKDDWEVLKPKEIDDPEDKKPEDWVDSSMMDDPEDKKPEDWVEEAKVVDSAATKPDDWDDEEDGDWEAPMIDNPAYKGAWVQKRISNPEYKGIWSPKKIANPEFKDDDGIYKYTLSYLGFDLWQVKGGTIFDNVIITDDKAEADAFAAKWKALNDVEKAKKKEEDDRKAEEAKAKADTTAEEDDDDEEEEDDDEEEKKDEM